ncbi:MAG: amino acid ABC transporter ATP-binding protein [Erysipelotrichaceae bacterium]|nr:amino acid ABC transporter ATP-binding protein [Erysipelotrichaceae bacterium]
MLGVRDLHKSFGDNQVLKGIDFEINKGEVVAVIGASGSGKTTFLRCISFLEKADKGEYIFDDLDKDITKISRKEIKALRMKMGFVFQNFNLFRNMTAIKNVTEGLTVVRKMPKEEAEKKALVLLEKVGMLEHAYKYPDELSGGQQQRVAIARALANDPEIVMFDEPTSALDPELIGEVLNVMTKLAKEGTTMIVVTHEMSFAADVASKVIFMEGGKIVEQGPPEQVLKNPTEESTKRFLRRILEHDD